MPNNEPFDHVWYVIYIYNKHTHEKKKYIPKKQGIFWADDGVDHMCKPKIPQMSNGRSLRFNVPLRIIANIMLDLI